MPLVISNVPQNLLMTSVHGLYLCIIESQIHLLDLWEGPQDCPAFPQHNLLSVAIILGTNFTLAELGICEPSPHRSGYCSDMGILHQGYSLSTGSDADSDTEGGMSPEHAIRLWGRGIKSRRSSGLSSRENSALTLTDSDNENKSDDDNGRPFLKNISMLYALSCWGLGGSFLILFVSKRFNKTIHLHCF